MDDLDYFNEFKQLNDFQMDYDNKRKRANKAVAYFIICSFVIIMSILLYALIIIV